MKKSILLITAMLLISCNQSKTEKAEQPQKPKRANYEIYSDSCTLMYDKIMIISDSIRKHQDIAIDFAQEGLIQARIYKATEEESYREKAIVLLHKSQKENPKIDAFFKEKDSLNKCYNYYYNKAFGKKVK